MATRTVSIGSTVGLHARPASLFTAAVADTGLDVTIAKGDSPGVDASSILMVMSLGAGHGDDVTLEANGAGAEDALDTLAQLLATDHDAH